MKVLSEKEIKKLLKEKYNSKDFKFDTKTNQNFIELINANFESKKTATNLHNVLTRYGYEPLNGFKKN